MATTRDNIVRWARWGVTNTGSIHYREVRPMPLTGRLPLTTDCSGFVTLCYKLAGAPDPNGLGYNGQGYTGTLLTHGTRIPLAAVKPGDVIVYGPGTGAHTAVVVEAGADPLTVSHGQESDPAYVRVSQDGRLPQTYLRFLPDDPAPGTVTITGPKGGLIARRPVAAAARLVPALVKRFGKIGIRKT